MFTLTIVVLRLRGNKHATNVLCFVFWVTAAVLFVPYVLIQAGDSDLTRVTVVVDLPAQALLNKGREGTFHFRVELFQPLFYSL